MGIVTSIFCTMTFCIERILTCTCCAFLLIMMLFGVLLMLIYGVSIGYHFSQKELANFAVQTRGEAPANRRAGGGVAPPDASDEDRDKDQPAPYVRLVAINKTSAGRPGRQGDVVKDEDQGKEVELVLDTSPAVNVDAQTPPPNLDDDPVATWKPIQRREDTKNENLLSRILSRIRGGG